MLSDKEGQLFQKYAKIENIDNTFYNDKHANWNHMFILQLNTTLSRIFFANSNELPTHCDFMHTP